MATKSAQPDPTAGAADGAPEAAAEQPTPTAPADADQAPSGRKPGGVFQYVDAVPRTYLFDGAPAQSAQYGDICRLPYDPDDGRWQPSTAKPTRLPDNDPLQVEVASATQAVARAQAHGDTEAYAAADKRRAAAQALIAKGA